MILRTDLDYVMIDLTQGDSYEKGFQTTLPDTVRWLREYC